MKTFFAALVLALGLAGNANAQSTPITIYAGKVQPLGYCQLTSLATATLLSACTFPTSVPLTNGLPTGANFVDIIVETQGIRYRDDGTAPTATVGMPLGVGTDKNFALANFAKMQFIAVTAGAILDVSFYQ